MSSGTSIVVHLVTLNKEKYDSKSGSRSANIPIPRHTASEVTSKISGKHVMYSTVSSKHYHTWLRGKPDE
jgi:hypothetical protein